MAEDIENTIRDISAELSCLRFATEILLTNFITSLPEEHRKPFTADFLRVAAKSDHLRATDEVYAERQADIFVRSQQRLEGLIDRAYRRATTG